jgi:hypothetical protein
MKRILIPISFSKASKNSLFHGSTLFEKSHLTLVHIFPSQSYNRKFDFGKTDYETGVREKLKHYYTKHVKTIAKNTTFLASSGVVSEFVASKSHLYDLLIMTRKSHATKKQGYLSEKKLYITTKARCPVLIMPFMDKPFKFDTCSHVWHIKRKDSESKVVEKWNKSLSINQEVVEEKSLHQDTFISSFWQNIVQYQNTHNESLLKVIDKAHESEPIDLIILVDNNESIFTRFFKSDTIKLFCKYDIPILILPPQR